MIIKLALAVFLLAHAGIHAGFVSARPPVTADGPAWPFDLAHSWLLSPLGASADITRLLGWALFAATLAGFALAAVAVIGLLPASLWVPAAAVGSIASLSLLLLFFKPWLVLGVGIDVVLLWAVLMADWNPASITN